MEYRRRGMTQKPKGNWRNTACGRRHADVRSFGLAYLPTEGTHHAVSVTRDLGVRDRRVRNPAERPAVRADLRPDRARPARRTDPRLPARCRGRERRPGGRAGEGVRRLRGRVAVWGSSAPG